MHTESFSKRILFLFRCVVQKELDVSPMENIFANTRETDFGIFPLLCDLQRHPRRSLLKKALRFTQTAVNKWWLVMTSESGPIIGMYCMCE